MERTSSGIPAGFTVAGTPSVPSSIPSTVFLMSFLPVTLPSLPMVIPSFNSPVLILMLHLDACFLRSSRSQISVRSSNTPRGTMNDSCHIPMRSCRLICLASRMSVFLFVAPARPGLMTLGLPCHDSKTQMWYTLVDSIT